MVRSSSFNKNYQNGYNWSWSVMNTLSLSTIKKNVSQIQENQLLYLVIICCFYINIRDIDLLENLKKITMFSLCVLIIYNGFKLVKTSKDLILPSLIIILTFINFYFTREFYILSDSLILLT